MKISKVDLAYMAGIIDGEGYLGIWFDPRNNAASPKIVVEMSHLESIQWLQNLYAGYKIQKIFPRNIKHQITYRWEVWGKDAVKIVQLLLPFLKAKRREAELFITFPFHSAGKGRPIPLPTVKKRMELKTKLSSLKTKGKGVLKYVKKIS